MSPLEQRIAIAKLCPTVAKLDGAGVPVWIDRWEYPESSGSCVRMEFDPLEDLNAMHAAISTLPDWQQTAFAAALSFRAGEQGKYVHQLNAKDWADSFLKAANATRVQL